ncbi:MAG: transketolase [Chloroflexi bacterium]|nr:transketolase [Chloroflexota bacterium]MCY4247834.1 transketolase [Chloroflexota bacterium]
MPDLTNLAINAIRALSMDAVQKANSGHPGLPMGAAPVGYTLWLRHLRHNPRNPSWADRDRFVLSAGHGSMLLYSLLHLTGYDLSLDEIKNFRQWGSKTPGHPEYGHTPGVETTTGPLGQGAATAVGMALAEAYLAGYFNRPGHDIIDHHTYVLVSDGDLMEGVCLEACALAGHWGLGKLIFLYDDNQVTLDGAARMTFSEDVAQRFLAMGWHVDRVPDGTDVAAISRAIDQAKAKTDKPSLIAVRSIIGYGSPNKQGSSAAHGSPLGVDEVALAKKNLGWSATDSFFIPDKALEHFRSCIDAGAAAEGHWQRKYEAWRVAYPELAADYERAQAGEFAAGWRAELPSWEADMQLATRSAGGEALNALAHFAPTMIGGDADLAGSTRTLIKGAQNTGPGQPAERNLRFGVREHAMGAIVNGLALHGGMVKPYSATFFTFSDYMRPAIRLGALMNLPTVYVFTHDSIGLGEDGPTHQPVEQLMSLRVMPNLHVFRPADATETTGAWAAIAELPHPAAIVLSRQNLPALAGNDAGIIEGVARGAYVLSEHESKELDVIIIATGSEVAIALDAAGLLEEADIRARVVSMPCWELFEAQSDEYKAAVLPPEVTCRVSIEAGATLGWERYIGTDGIALGVDRFGASAPYTDLYQQFGLTPGHLAEAVSSLLDD